MSLPPRCLSPREGEKREWTGNAKLVQRYLGHSDVATTRRFYVDVFPEDLERAAEILSGKEPAMVGELR